MEGEFEAYLEAEKLDRSTAVQKFLAEGLEDWRRELAFEQLAVGQIAFSKAGVDDGAHRLSHLRLGDGLPASEPICRVDGRRRHRRP